MNCVRSLEPLERKLVDKAFNENNLARLKTQNEIVTHNARGTAAASPATSLAALSSSTSAAFGPSSAYSAPRPAIFSQQPATGPSIAMQPAPDRRFRADKRELEGADGFGWCPSVAQS